MEEPECSLDALLSVGVHSWSGAQVRSSHSERSLGDADMIVEDKEMLACLMAVMEMPLIDEAPRA